MAIPAETSTSKASVVLVHGAFADATGWQHVIPLLEDAGYFVLAVQNPLTSLATDVETTRRAIEGLKGPIIAVGHSYGGAVITGAAAGNANVKALVYIAAFAPDAEEPVGAFLEQYPSALSGALRPDAAGFAYIDRAQFSEVFAANVPEVEARVMAATQKPINGGSFGATLDQAAWRTTPSWYMVATEDHTINPVLERFYAERMKATTEEIDSSHVPFITHPEAVVQLIETAAEESISASARREEPVAVHAVG